MNRYHVALLLFLVLVASLSVWMVHDVLTEGDITPNDEFFELSIGRVPEIDGEAWNLEVVGLVNTTLTLTLGDIRAMPAVEVTATLK